LLAKKVRQYLTICSILRGTVEQVRYYQLFRERDLLGSSLTSKCIADENLELNQAILERA